MFTGNITLALEPTVSPKILLALARCTLVSALKTIGTLQSLSVIEQITYLLFAKRLDDMQTAKEAQANTLGEPVEGPVFLKKQGHA